MSRVFCVGHAVQDYIFSTSEMPSKARKYRATNFTSIGGGPAANAAVAIRKLGGEALLAARIGDDAIGDTIVGELEKEQVDCTYLKRFPDTPSSLSTVIVDGAGERMIVNYQPDELPTDASWLTRTFPKKIDAVLTDIKWPEGALIAMKEARTLGIPAILDADLETPDNDEFLTTPTHIAFAADSLRYLTNEKNLKTGLQLITQRTDSWCCVTDGANGTLIAEGQTVHHIPAFQVEAVDTLGAGDIWHGSFALSMADGLTENESVKIANACAAIKVTRPGGRNGTPTRADVEMFLSTPPLRRS